MPAAAAHYLGFAGGSAASRPLLSIIKTVLAREPHSRFTLVYANRQISSIMFREELEDLKNLYLGRFSVMHVLKSEAQEIDLFTGRIDAEKCTALFRHWIDVKSVRTAFICGPEPMMLAIAASFATMGCGTIRSSSNFSPRPSRAAHAVACRSLLQAPTRARRARQR